MPWKKTDSLLKRRLNQHGLAGIVEASSICKKAEELRPGLFRAVSVRNDVLHLELSKANLLTFKMSEGQLLQALNAYAKQKGIPPISRLRLTFLEE